jgi:biotin transport system substrate-specific component
MALTMTENKVLAEVWGPTEGTGRLVKQAVLVVVGIILLAVAAKVKVSIMPVSPVAISLGTFAVLTIGAAYGPRLGLVTILGWMIVGALGFDVFQNSSAEAYGISYMTGTTGGYLLGYVLAVLALGWAARAGWDRSVIWMAVAMLIGNALIYLPGVLWLGVLIEGGMYQADDFGSVTEQALAWGLWPFLLGDAIKLALAALVLPAVWKLVGNARA